jgi:hypothetical protein
MTRLVKPVNKGAHLQTATQVMSNSSSPVHHAKMTTRKTVVTAWLVKPANKGAHLQKAT